MNSNIRKSTVMLLLSTAVTALSLFIHLLHRQFNFLEVYVAFKGVTSLSPGMIMFLNGLLVIPIICLLLLYWAYVRQHSLEQLFTTLTLTFASISIIAGGDGLTEYHFSIFMVVAMIASLQKIRYIMISTIIFALHHLAGYFFFPQLLCGTTDYSFSLLMIHAVFLIMTALSTSVVILFTRRNEQALAAERAAAECKLQHMLEEIAAEGEHLKELADHLKTGAATTADTSSSITASLANFHETAEAEARVLQSSIADTEESFMQLTAISDRTTKLEEKAKASLHEAVNGKMAMQTVSKQMHVITESISSVKALIEMLATQSIDISNSLTIVHKISEQTKLLALNASIEAARAGESGKGFAVVAKEIGHLASTTQQSVGEMDTALEGISTKITEVAAKMQDGMTEIYRGNDILVDSEQSFHTIHELVSNLQVDVEHIVGATSELVAQTNHSVTLFNNIAETNLSSLQTVDIITQSAKQQHGAVAHLEEAIMQLNDVTAHFQELTTKVQKPNE